MNIRIEEAAGRRVGTVEHVSASKVEVLIDDAAPQGVALNVGGPIRFPAVNGFLLMPVEAGAIVGLVTSISIRRYELPSSVKRATPELIELPYPVRTVEITPLGTLRMELSGQGALGLKLDRGVHALPSVGDAVLLPTEEETRAIVESQTSGPRVLIGRSPHAREASIYVNPDRLFARHLAVLGNTGSGKSCSVAGLIRWSLQEAIKLKERPNARFILLDPNGEYTKAFSDLPGVTVLKAEVEGDGASPLRVPAWLWDSTEWAALTAASAGTQRPILQRALRDMRAGQLLEESPLRQVRLVVRYHLRRISSTAAADPSEYQIYPGLRRFCDANLSLSRDLTTFLDVAKSEDENVGTLMESTADFVNRKTNDHHWESGAKSGWNAFDLSEVLQIRDAVKALDDVLPEMVDYEGPSEDAPIPFDSSQLADHVEQLAQAESSQVSQFVSTMALRIRTMTSDVRMKAVVGGKSADESMLSWLEAHLGTESKMPSLVVMDLSLVPSEIIHMVAGVTARVVFEALQRYKRTKTDALPTVLVLEEAHHFLQHEYSEERWLNTSAGFCKKVFDKIAREGRKYGLGLVLSSQRPAELSATTLSQCNTFLIHRTVNDRDQHLIGRLVPDNVSSLINDLPSLPTQQAILVGWATTIPLLVEMRTLPADQRPSSGDPAFWRVWTGEEDRSVDWGPIVEKWTGVIDPGETGEAPSRTSDSGSGGPQPGP